MENTLPPVKRYVTTHDANGKAIFSNAFPVEVTPDIVPFHAFANSWTIAGGVKDGAAALPNLTGDVDFETYRANYPKMQQLHVDRGTVLRVVDFQPNLPLLMHRTQTIDFGVVLKGPITAVLDSGEEKVLNTGDLIVQRGTMHSWRNDGPEYARMAFMLQRIEPLVVVGQTMEEDVPWAHLMEDGMKEHAQTLVANEAGEQLG